MKFEIKNRIITGDKDLIVVGDNADYVAEFSFDEEWSGITKTARFISCNGDYVDQILEEDYCFVPCEVLKCGYCRVGVYSAEKTTTEHKFFVNKSIKNDTGNVCEPTPDVYEQILNKIDNIVITGGGTGTSNYNDLANKPSINGVELRGNKTTEELGIVSCETDPTVPSHVKSITQTDINNWNNKVSQGQLNETNSNVADLDGKKADQSYVESVRKSLAGQNEYIGSYQSSDYTADTIQDVLSTFVIENTNPSRERRNGDIINIVNGIYSGQQWIYNGNEATWKYYIDFANHSVINNLTSDSEIDGLSAKQGKVLNDKIEEVKTDYVKDDEFKQLKSDVGTLGMGFGQLLDRISTLENKAPTITTTQLEDGSYSLSITMPTEG